MAHYIEVEESLLIGPSLNTSFSPQPQAAETAAKPSSWHRPAATRRLSNRESSLLQPNNQTEALRVPAFRV